MTRAIVLNPKTMMVGEKNKLQMEAMLIHH
jgi:hypothetical protein